MIDVTRENRISECIRSSIGVTWIIDEIPKNRLRRVFTRV